MIDHNNWRFRRRTKGVLDGTDISYLDDAKTSQALEARSYVPG